MIKKIRINGRTKFDEYWNENFPKISEKAKKVNTYTLYNIQ